MSNPNALLVVAVLIAGRTAWALFVSGSAANNDRGFTRGSSPNVFWLSILFGCVAVVVCVGASIWMRITA